MGWIDPYTSQIQGFEGYVPKAAWDYKQFTNGYGTRAAYPGETIDKDTASKRFADEIKKASDSVDSFAPNAPPGVKAALTSLTFNAGPKWQEQGLGQAVKSGDYGTAKNIFVNYNHAGGETNPGLVTRRNAEAGWFDKPAQASINGGFGVSPTGDAGIAGPVDTADAGHGIPASPFTDLQSAPPPTTNTPNTAVAGGFASGLTPKNITSGLGSIAGAFSGGMSKADSEAASKATQEALQSAAKDNASMIDEGQQRQTQALQTILAKLKTAQPQAAFG